MKPCVGLKWSLSLKLFQYVYIIQHVRLTSSVARKRKYQYAYLLQILIDLKTNEKKKEFYLFDFRYAVSII
jgi:hypothetical protein